jgi:hypothetical protein
MFLPYELRVVMQNVIRHERLKQLILFTTETIEHTNKHTCYCWRFDYVNSESKKKNFSQVKPEITKKISSLYRAHTPREKKACECLS